MNCCFDGSTTIEAGLPKYEHVKAELARRSLKWFVRFGWPVLEPGTDLHWNWHIDAICDHLQAIRDGSILRLLINIPPGHMKSLLVSVFWPAWMWIDRPEWRSLFSSYSMELALRDSVKCRDLIASDWYQEWFRPEWRFKDDTNAKGFYENTRRGFRVAMSVGGRGTGWRGDCIITDDPLNAEDAHSEAALKAHVRWWDKTMSTRLNDQRTGARVIIMQRLHEDDLAGHVIRQGGYEKLILPTEYEPERHAKTSIGWEDPRVVPGELLFRTLFPVAVVRRLKTDLGSDGFAGQHQQRPSPAEGGILKRAWWQSYSRRPETFDEVIQSWDFTYKDTKSSDFVAGQVWGRKGASKYLLDQIHARLDFVSSVKAMQALSTRWPRARLKLVEDAANGPAIISQLKDKIPGIVAVTPDGSKIARAYAIQPDVEAGNVYLPDDELAAAMAQHWQRIASMPDSWLREEYVSDQWVADFIEECAGFPNAKKDDRVDACTQALRRLDGTGHRGHVTNYMDFETRRTRELI